jgi:hypothetical protein
MKTLKSSLKVDFNDVTADFIHEVYKKITLDTCCTLLSFVAEQQLSSRVSYSVAA